MKYFLISIIALLFGAMYVFYTTYNDAHPSINDEIQLSVGKTYREYFANENPFKSPYIDTITIIEQKEGYIKYNSTLFHGVESGKIHSFSTYIEIVK